MKSLRCEDALVTAALIPEHAKRGKKHTIAHSTALATSASSNTIRLDLPPSSSVTGVSRRAAAAATAVPVALEPVNASFRMLPCCESGCPAAAPVPETTLRTPAGRPTSVAYWPSSRHVRDACSDGLSTTVQPAFGGRRSVN